MQYDHILIRYGEITTKGRNRSRFTERLRRNIRQKLHAFTDIQIQKTRDRMYIKLNGESHEEIIEKLKVIFGIHSFSLAVKTESEIEAIKEAALQVYTNLDYEGKTFKVTAKRADKQFSFSSNELNYEIGSHLLKNIDGLTVNVHQPDINVRIEVRNEATYITCQDIIGLGGLPVGTSGKAMLMLSGGIDSPVAGYFALKRGLEIEAIHFHSPPYTSERSKQKVIDLAEKLSEYCGVVKVHVVPFTEIQEAIQKQVPKNYTMTSTRRMMLKVADEIREKAEALAISTGESLGQVASQTLESMYAINEVTTTPIIRPLITMDKTEVMAVARQIDTYDISIRPYEDCCTIFTPASPKTKPKREKINYYESFLDDESLIEKAVSNTEVITITNDNRIGETEFDDLF